MPRATLVPYTTSQSTCDQRHIGGESEVVHLPFLATCLGSHALSPLFSSVQLDPLVPALFSLPPSTPRPWTLDGQTASRRCEAPSRRCSPFAPSRTANCALPHVIYALCGYLHRTLRAEVKLLRFFPSPSNAQFSAGSQQGNSSCKLEALAPTYWLSEALCCRCALSPLARIRVLIAGRSLQGIVAPYRTYYYLQRLPETRASVLGGQYGF
ncbi:hypothetical protein BKA93DRAFT_451784 [Sparassis latifolia]